MTNLNCRLFRLYVVLFCAVQLLPGCVESSYDLVIRNALIYDGTGAEPYKSDVAIDNGVIVEISDHVDHAVDKEIDAARRVLAPGFIDVHAHIEPIAIYPEAESFLRQGVTTTFGGPDGSSPLPLGPYLDSIERIVPGVNTGYLIGHGSVRANVLGLEDRAPTDDELSEMKRQVEEAMAAGAFGISTGLKYLPGTFATTDEVIEVSKSAGISGGVYTSHLRDEGLQLLAGVEEAITIARETEMTVVLTHHKVIGQPMWGASEQTLAMVDSARELGRDVRIDQYPYTASHTSLAVLIPPWSLEGDRVLKFRERCKDPTLRDSIHAGIVYNIRYDRGGNDLSRIQFARFDWKPELAGQTLYDWAILEGLEPTAENGAELVIRAQENGGAKCIYHVMDDQDLIRIMQHPQTMVASDGRLSIMGKGHPHPRAFGTFPRVLGTYVREQKVLTLAEAIHKMTGMPADLMGLKDRGLIKEGFKADLVIFDAANIADRATFEDPHHYPTGIEYVIVNGSVALSPNGLSDQRFGEVLRSPSFKD